jgi:hypothetical protein
MPTIAFPPNFPTTRKKNKPEPAETHPVAQHLYDLVKVLPECPALLRGKVRHIKVERFLRERQGVTWATPTSPIETCKINLTGHWIANAGFAADQRIQVIPMENMLIIIPESENYEK